MGTMQLVLDLQAKISRFRLKLKMCVRYRLVNIVNKELNSSAMSSGQFVKLLFIHVPDKRSQILEVIVVRRIFNLGTGNLEWGGNGEGPRKGKSVYE
jgi:hypothetical protein